MHSRMFGYKQSQLSSTAVEGWWFGLFAVIDSVKNWRQIESPEHYKTEQRSQTQQLIYNRMTQKKKKKSR